MEKTVGEKRVRTEFNPSKEVEGIGKQVQELKQKAAELINMCEDLKSKDARLAALAQTCFEEGAMWAVKAATA